MDTQLVTTQVRHKSRQVDYLKQQESSLSIKEWCRNNSIGEKTFYYILKVIRKEACESLRTVEEQSLSRPFSEKSRKFVKVNFSGLASQGDGITIKLDHVEINISPDSNNEHVRMVLGAMANA